MEVADDDEPVKLIGYAQVRYHLDLFHEVSGDGV